MTTLLCLVTSEFVDVGVFFCIKNMGKICIQIEKKACAMEKIWMQLVFQHSCTHFESRQIDTLSKPPKENFVSVIRYLLLYSEKRI
jgi:hypothetical protein